MCRSAGGAAGAALRQEAHSMAVIYVLSALSVNSLALRELKAKKLPHSQHPCGRDRLT